MSEKQKPTDDNAREIVMLLEDAVSMIDALDDESEYGNFLRHCDAALARAGRKVEIKTIRENDDE